MRDSPEQVAKLLLSRHDLTLISINTLQSLWAGYGSICALKARPNTIEAAERIIKLLYEGASLTAHTSTDIPLILKFISPPQGKDGDEGHQRKMLSYEVEQHFYTTLAPRLSSDATVATCLASTEGSSEGLDDGVVAMVMADLRVEFPVAGGKREALQQTQVYAAIDWLASFHRESRAWLSSNGARENFILPPLEEAERRRHGHGGNDVWLNGGYTYLATRRKEYRDLEYDTESEWSKAFCTKQPDLGCSIADAVAEVLKPRGRASESYIHGDVKSENLFTTKAGTGVAFFDFQYIGLGLGVCDLAKLFTCSVPLNMLDEGPLYEAPMGKGETELLRQYHEALRLGVGYSKQEFLRHWECALVDWCRFQASWGFWGNTEWLESRVRSILRDDAWTKWLRNELDLIRKGEK